MNRRELLNACLIALAAASSVGLWLLRDEPTTSELASRKDKLLPRFQTDRVQRLTLTKDRRTLELTRDSASGDFRIVRPWAERADTATVRQLLEALDLASIVRRVEKLPSASTSDDTATLEVSIGAESFEIQLRGPAESPPGARYAQVLLEGRLLQQVVVSQGVAAELDVPLHKFRETRLLEYGRRELKKLGFTSQLGKLELEQREHGAFFFSQGGRSELVEPLALERILTALSRISSEQLVEPEQARAALQNDPLTVVLETTEPGRAPLTLTFAAGCYQAAELATVLREEPGKAPRAGCLAADVASALRVTASDLRLQGAFAATPDAVEELALQSGPRKLSLARKDKGWILRSAGNRELPLEAGNQRVSALVAARGHVTEGDAKSLGLEPAAGEAVIQVTGSDEATHREERVLLGQARADGGLCIERKLDGVRLCFDKAAAAAFDADASLLRSAEVLHFAPSELAELTIDAPGRHERVARGPEGGFALEEPKGFLHDGSLVADAVQSLGTLQAVRWVSASAEPRHGFGAPRLRVTARLTSGATHELSVGAATEGGVFARLAADPAVFVLGSAALADLETPLIDRALCPFAQAELARVELRQKTRNLSLVRGSDSWQGGGLQPSRVAQLVDALSALRAEQALHVGPPARSDGFEHPLATITFSNRQGLSKRLVLGERRNLGDEPVVLARLEGVDATFALSARTVEDLSAF